MKFAVLVQHVKVSGFSFAIKSDVYRCLSDMELAYGDERKPIRKVRIQEKDVHRCIWIYAQSGLHDREQA